MDSDKILYVRCFKIEKIFYLFIILFYLLRYVIIEMKMCIFINVLEIIVMYIFILLFLFLMFVLGFFFVKMLIIKKY